MDSGWEYQITWVDAPSNIADYGNRRIDIYSHDFLNEMKTGKVYNTKFIRGEAIRDEYLVEQNGGHGGHACHGSPHCGYNWGAAGAIWWYSAKGTMGCQTWGGGKINFTRFWCPSKALRNNVASKGIQAMYVIYVKANRRKNRQEAKAYYRKDKYRQEVRKAVFTNFCPVGLKSLPIPHWKTPFPPIGPSCP